MSMKNSNHTIGNQTCDLLASSALPQPTALLHAPWYCVTNILIKKQYKAEQAVDSAHHYHWLATNDEMRFWAGICVTWMDVLSQLVPRQCEQILVLGTWLQCAYSAVDYTHLESFRLYKYCSLDLVSCQMYGTLLRYLKITVIRTEQTALCSMRILQDKTPVMQAHVYFTPPVYAAIQMAVRNLKIIKRAKGEPGVRTM